MNKIREIFDAGKPEIISERKRPGAKTMTVRVPWIQSGEKTGNGRIYPEALLKREVARIQKAVSAGSMIGTGDHSRTGFPNIETASHILQKVWLDNQGKGFADMRIIGTERGKNIIELINQGAQLGVSLMGFGTIDGKTGVVQNDFHLSGIDIVTNPSYKEGVFNKDDIFESLNFEEDNLDNLESQQKKDLEEEVSKLEIETFLSARESGFVGSQKDWDRMYGGNLRKMMGLEESTPHTSEEKLTEQQIKGRTFSYFEEAVRGGFRGSFDEWKEKFPKIVERASRVVKISERKMPEPETPFKSKITWQEAKLAGFVGTVDEFRKKYPDIVLEAPRIPEKPITETLEQEATRIFTELKKQNPNSALKLEHVRNMLEKEEEEKVDKRLRKKAIAIVSRDLAGNVPQATIEKMVEKEIEVLKEERAERKRKNWLAYKRLLDE